MSGQKINRDVDLDIAGEGAGDKARRTVDFLAGLLDKAKSNVAGGMSRHEVFENMDKCQDFYEMKHWAKKMPQHRAMSITNHCFANVESALPIITDRRPKAELIAGHQDDLDTVRKLKALYDAKYEDLDCLMKTESEIKRALIISEGYWKIFWNPLKIGGLGDVDIINVDPRRMFFLGGTDPQFKDAYAVIYHGAHTLGELKGWYPKKASLIETEWVSANMDSEFTGSTSVAGNAGMNRAVTDDGTGDIMQDTRAGAIRDGTESMYLTEAWIDDKTTFRNVPEYIVTPVGDKFDVVGKWNEQLETQMINSGTHYEVISGTDLPQFGFEERVEWLRKYPYGRIIASVGHLLLEDKPSIYTHGRSPYVRFYVCPIPGRNYYYGMINQIVAPQMELNKRKSQIIDILSLTANPPMLINIMAGIKASKMTNEPGLLIPVTMDVDRAAKWMQVPNFPSALFESVISTTNDIATISGIHDITQGRKPVGITAGVAIESMQEAAETRLRQMARYLEYSQKHAAELMVSIIFQFYIENRIVRVADKDNPGKYIYDNANFMNVELAGGLPDILIKSGSTMPVNEAVRRGQGMQLFELGAIDQRELLELFDWQNVDEIIARMEQKAQETAQAQMQAQRGMVQ